MYAGFGVIKTVSGWILLKGLGVDETIGVGGIYSLNRGMSSWKGGDVDEIALNPFPNCGGASDDVILGLSFEATAAKGNLRNGGWVDEEKNTGAGVCCATTE